MNVYYFFLHFVIIAFDLYCNLIRSSGVRGTASSKASLLARWNALSEEEKNVLFL